MKASSIKLVSPGRGGYSAPRAARQVETLPLLDASGSDAHASCANEYGRRANGNGTVFKDPAFLENKTLPIHRWVPWIAGYSASFVQSVLESYLDGETHSEWTVLDPFAGVGTTLIQAAVGGHNVVGFELNPYAALVAQSKLDAVRVDLVRLERTISRLVEQSNSWQTEEPGRDRRPKHFKSRIPFFSLRVERQIQHALNFIAHERDRLITDLLRISFGAVMVSLSNYSYEPSLSSRPSADKPLIEDADVAITLITKLHQIRNDIAWWKAQALNGCPPGNGTVHCADFLSDNARLPTGSVRLVVTSPPYMNNYHYVRNTRPQLYWLSLIHSSHDQRALEEGNFGKYWQVVRDRKEVALTFTHHDLDSLIRLLRTVRRERGLYGGQGWANYVSSYFNDCQRMTFALKRVLARGGSCVVVVGNSILQGIEFKVEQFLADIATQSGLKVEGIQRVREKRVGASITRSTVRRGAPNTATLYESVVMMKKR